MAEPYRDSPDAIANLWVSNRNGMRVPLSQVADIRLVEGTPTVSREDAQRRIVVQCNVRGRDMGGFVQEAQQAVREQVDLPAGYFVTWGGQFENQRRAQATLMVVLPVCLGLIFILLFMSFNSVKDAFLIILNVPFALIGGILSLAISGQYLSVPSSVLLLVSSPSLAWPFSTVSSWFHTLISWCAPDFRSTKLLGRVPCSGCGPSL